MVSEQGRRSSGAKDGDDSIIIMFIFLSNLEIFAISRLDVLKLSLFSFKENERDRIKLTAGNLHKDDDCMVH